MGFGHKGIAEPGCSCASIFCCWNGTQTFVSSPICLPKVAEGNPLIGLPSGPRMSGTSEGFGSLLGYAPMANGSTTIAILKLPKILLKTSKRFLDFLDKMSSLVLTVPISQIHHHLERDMLAMARKATVPIQFPVSPSLNTAQFLVIITFPLFRTPTRLSKPTPIPPLQIQNPLQQSGTQPISMTTRPAIMPYPIHIKPQIPQIV